jgi:hypothetical protein
VSLFQDAVLQGFGLKNRKSPGQNRARLAHSQLILELAHLSVLFMQVIIVSFFSFHKCMAPPLQFL